jgi:NAD(P)-dependent dehydrogenase (short-subunit alcohol dehydrogenase family)
VSEVQQTWFITGAGRGMGVDIAQAALAAADAVVATGRDLLAQDDAQPLLSTSLDRDD